MRRNLDMTALRSFVATAEAGGVTRAAGLLNLTQSAVSMQLKRLEESLGVALLDRAGRGVALTAEGDQLLSYARKIIEMNDEAVARMTADEYEGEVRLGIPHDIVTGLIPPVLKRFSTSFPRMRVQFVTVNTIDLLEDFSKGRFDIIITTEEKCGIGGETLATVPLVWVGAPEGQAWRARPLPIAFEAHCIFRPQVQKRLDRAGTPWKMVVDSNATRAIEATVSADLAIHAMMGGFVTPGLVPIDHGGALPELAAFRINLYESPTQSSPAQRALADELRAAYGTLDGQIGPGGTSMTGVSPRPSPLSVVSG